MIDQTIQALHPFEKPPAQAGGFFSFTSWFYLRCGGPESGFRFPPFNVRASERRVADNAGGPSELGRHVFRAS